MKIATIIATLASYTFADDMCAEDTAVATCKQAMDDLHKIFSTATVNEATDTEMLEAGRAYNVLIDTPCIHICKKGDCSQHTRAAYAYERPKNEVIEYSADCYC